MDKLEQKSLQKLPPYDIEAEQAVLGAILIDNAAIHKALEIFNGEDFYKRYHQKIFEAMLDRLNHGDAIDLLTLRDELEKRGDLDQVGGPAYLAALVDQIPTAANIESHAKVVHEKAIARNLLNASIEIATRCYDANEDVGVLMADAEQKIFTIAEGKVKRPFVSMQEVVSQGYDRIEQLSKEKKLVTGVPTGFVDIDRLTAGLQPSDLVIIAARPAMGKTTLCLCLAKEAGVSHQIPTAIFSLEMSKEQLGIRFLCMEAKLNSQDVRIGKLHEDDWDRLAHASDALVKAPIYIDDTPAISMTDIRAKTKRLAIEKGLGLVIVDYLQLMQSVGKHENRQQEITEISRSLKALAKELNVPVVALSQLSRAVELRKDKRPILSDLRESGAIEQDADVVMFIYRPEVYGVEDMEGLAEIIIGKQRMGPVGSVQLAFIKQCTRFETLETRQVAIPESQEEAWYQK